MAGSERLAPTRGEFLRFDGDGIAPLAVYNGQPLAQVSGSFIWGGTVERHHRAGAAGRPADLGPPLVDADARDLDRVLAAIDRLFNAVNCHVCNGEVKS